MQLAHHVGVALSEFWLMTPWQLSTISEADGKKSESEQTASLGIAWYTAAFSRAAKLPPLKEVIGERKSQSKKIDEGAIMSAFHSYQVQRDEKKHGNGS